MDLKDFEKHIIPKIEAGRSIEAVRNIIKTGQYAEQDGKESLKETFKLITDELEKVDEGIHKLKDELQDIKAIEGPPALPEIEGPPQDAIEGKKKKKSKEPVNIDFYDVINPENLDIAKAYGFPDPIELLDSRNPKEFNEVAMKVGKELKIRGGRKGHVKGEERKRLDEDSNALREYKKLIEGFPKKIKPPKKGRGVFYYNNPRNLFKRLNLLGGSIIAGYDSVKN